jgi:rRNA maturation endonuclease Nob1
MTLVGEALVAALVGVAAFWLVLQPLLRPSRRTPAPVEPIDPEETPRGIALTALKEIEFDRETGKLSDADYEFLKAKYTATALEALRQEPVVAGSGTGGVSDDVEALIAAKVRALRSASTPTTSDPRCVTCGPRPEPDAIYCSTCGRHLPIRSVCNHCGAALMPESRFCEACGQQVAA